MDKKITYVLIAAVLIIVVAGVAVFATGGEDEEADDVTFLIQDSDGVYFWAFGEGETVMDAFKDATVEFEMPFNASKDSETNADNGIASLFGLEMKQVGEDWFWWTQYTWQDDAWVQSNLMMNKYSPADANHFVACVYGDGKLDTKTLATPKDAVVWDKDTSGVTFTIQNGDNLFFKVNGNGKYVFDAFKSMTNDYNIDFKPSKDKDGVEYGIDSLFGLEMNKVEIDGKDVWHYWSQYYQNDAGEWIYSDLGMNQIPIDMYSNAKFVYV